MLYIVSPWLTIFYNWKCSRFWVIPIKNITRHSFHGIPPCFPELVCLELGMPMGGRHACECYVLCVLWWGPGSRVTAIKYRPEFLSLPATFLTVSKVPRVFGQGTVYKAALSETWAWVVGGCWPFNSGFWLQPHSLRHPVRHPVGTGLEEVEEASSLSGEDHVAILSLTSKDFHGRTWKRWGLSLPPGLWVALKTLISDWGSKRREWKVL